MNRMQKILFFFFFNTKKVLVYFCSLVYSVFGTLFVSVLKMSFVAQIHSNLKDNYRKCKAFLTGRLVSLLLVSQAVIHTVFISGAELLP